MPRPQRRSRPPTAVLALGAVLVGLTGCGPGPAAPPPPAEIGPAADCLADDVVLALTGRAPEPPVRRAPEPGTVPEDFVPVQVVECSLGPLDVRVLEPAPVPDVEDLVDLEDLDGLVDGQRDLLEAPSSERTSSPATEADPAAIRIHEITREGDLTGLLSALDRPSRETEPGQVCPAVAILVPELYLVDRDGRAVRPVWPHDGCRFPDEAVGHALLALPKVGVRDLERPG